jgi:hypothetical protein
MQLLSNVLLGTFVILAYLQNGRLERTVCLQTRLSTWEKHYETSELLQAAFEEETMGNK